MLYPAVDDRSGMAIRSLAPEYPRLGTSAFSVILGTPTGLEFWDDREANRPAAVVPWRMVVGVNGPGPASTVGGLRVRVRRGERAGTAEIPLRPGGVGPQSLPPATVDVLANRLRALGAASGLAEDVAEERSSVIALLPGRDSAGYSGRAGRAAVAAVASIAGFFLIMLVPVELRREPYIFVPAMGFLAAFFVLVFASWAQLQYARDRSLQEAKAGYRITGARWPVGPPLVDRRTGRTIDVPAGTAPPGTV